MQFKNIKSLLWFFAFLIFPMSWVRFLKTTFHIPSIMLWFGYLQYYCGLGPSIWVDDLPSCLYTGYQLFLHAVLVIKSPNHTWNSRTCKAISLLKFTISGCYLLITEFHASYSFNTSINSSALEVFNHLTFPLTQMYSLL